MPMQLIQGNKACALGALAAGCRFFGGYPITPSTEIAEGLAQELPKVGGKFIQMEDEIASMASIIGASIGGLKSMTATSGPGFSLMQENLGYAAMTEIPCVVVNVQRLGPSTGRPTSPSQGDVMQARYGTHGDHPIIALSPASVRECFDLTVKAFEFSERYRTPVILLMDEVTGHMREKVDLPTEPLLPAERELVEVPPEWYEIYGESHDDVPPLSSFGRGYRFHITGLHHDIHGFPTNRLDEVHSWIDRVFRKIEDNLDDIVLTKAEWTEDMETLVVAYGCTYRSARHAVRQARQQGHKIGLLKLSTIWPFAESQIEELGKRAEHIIVPELNLGQVGSEIERIAGRDKVRRINRIDGQMIEPDEILVSYRYWVSTDWEMPLEMSER
jgi:2-oxoglutarate/2-oxoacid ferredoxin oxidoreductase subunit alpha